MKTIGVDDTSTRRGGMLDALTSFRFIAALMVFAWHTHLFSTYLDRLQLGYVGVGFFYILSGFILTYVYFTKMRKFNTRAIYKFYIARIAKIYPLHILTFLLALPLAFGIVNGSLTEQIDSQFIGTAASNVLLVQSYSPDPSVHFSFNGVAWSISVEMFFYALFPFIIVLFAACYKKLTIRRWLLLMVVSWLGMMLLLWNHPSHIDDWRFYILPLARLPDFVIGIMLGVVFFKLQQSHRAQKYKDRLNYTALEVTSVVVLACGVAASVYMPQSVRFAVWLMPFWAMVILIFSQQRGKVSSFFSHRLFVYLGEISFSFYMIHQLVIRYALEWQMSKPLMIVVSFVLSVALSAVTYALFEEPVRLRMKAFLEKRIIHRQKNQSAKLPVMQEATANDV